MLYFIHYKLIKTIIMIQIYFKLWIALLFVSLFSFQINAQKTIAGVVTEEIETKDGKFVLHRTNHLPKGKTISGTVMVEPKSDKTKKRAKQTENLKNYILKIGEQIISNDGVFAVKLPDIENVPLQIFSPQGKLIQEIPFELSEPIISNALKLPKTIRKDIVEKITGDFSGDITNANVLLNDKPVDILAGNDTELFFKVEDIEPGKQDLSMEYDDIKTTETINVVDYTLQAGKLNLNRGESTYLDVKVVGLEDLQEPLELKVQNKSVGTIRLEGGDLQTIVITPVEVAEKGTWQKRFDIQSLTRGSFNIYTELEKPNDFIDDSLAKKGDSIPAPDEMNPAGPTADEHPTTTKPSSKSIAEIGVPDEMNPTEPPKPPPAKGNSEIGVPDEMNADELPTAEPTVKGIAGKSVAESAAEAARAKKGNNRKLGTDLGKAKATATAELPATKAKGVTKDVAKKKQGVEGVGRETLGKRTGKAIGAADVHRLDSINELPTSVVVKKDKGKKDYKKFIEIDESPKLMKPQATVVKPPVKTDIDPCKGAGCEVVEPIRIFNNKSGEEITEGNSIQWGVVLRAELPEIMNSCDPDCKPAVIVKMRSVPNYLYVNRSPSGWSKHPIITRIESPGEIVYEAVYECYCDGELISAETLTRTIQLVETNNCCDRIRQQSSHSRGLWFNIGNRGSLSIRSHIIYVFISGVIYETFSFDFHLESVFCNLENNAVYAEVRRLMEESASFSNSSSESISLGGPTGDIEGREPYYCLSFLRSVTVNGETKNLVVSISINRATCEYSVQVIFDGEHYYNNPNSIYSTVEFLAELRKLNSPVESFYWNRLLFLWAEHFKLNNSHDIDLIYTNIIEEIREGVESLLRQGKINESEHDAFLSQLESDEDIPDLLLELAGEFWSN